MAAEGEKKDGPAPSPSPYLVHGALILAQLIFGGGCNSREGLTFHVDIINSMLRMLFQLGIDKFKCVALHQDMFCYPSNL